MIISFIALKEVSRTNYIKLKSIYPDSHILKSKKNWIKMSGCLDNMQVPTVEVGEKRNKYASFLSGILVSKLFVSKWGGYE